VGKLRSELVELLPTYSSQLPDADLRQVHVESLFILSKEAIKITNSQKPKIAAERGKIDIAAADDDAVQRALQLYPLSPLLSEQ